jgi:hypothetical protein
LPSDIRAELDKLPPSLIWGYEDSLLRPGRLLGVSGPEGYECLELHDGQLSVRDVMYHYLAQIHIRKTLNRAHAALYSAEGLNLSGMYEMYTLKLDQINPRRHGEERTESVGLTPALRNYGSSCKSGANGFPPTFGGGKTTILHPTSTMPDLEANSTVQHT